MMLKKSVSMVPYPCSPSTDEAEAGELSEVQEQSDLPRKILSGKKLKTRNKQKPQWICECWYVYRCEGTDLSPTGEMGL